MPHTNQLNPIRPGPKQQAAKTWVTSETVAGYPKELIGAKRD